MIIIENEKRAVAFADEGIWEVADFLQQPMHPGTPRSSAQAAHSIHGGLRPDQAIKVAKEGWQEGVDMVHELLGGVPLSENIAGQAKWTQDVCGYLPEVPKFLSGDPRHMRRHARKEGSRPVVHIVVNTALTGNSTGAQQTNYGVALCGLIDWLESHGKLVELDRLGVVDGGRRRSFQGWKIKRAAEVLDMSSVVFALAHMSSHRHLVWGMRNRLAPVRWMPVDVRQSDVALIGAEGAIILDSVLNDGRRCNTVHGACLLAAERVNRAAGEDVCDIEELRYVLEHAQQEAA